MRSKQLPILVAILALAGASLLPTSWSSTERALAMAAAAAIAYELTDWLMEKRAQLRRARTSDGADAKLSQNGPSAGPSAKNGKGR